MTTPIPVDHINSQLQQLGRSLTDAIVVRHFWEGDDYRLQLNWPDGFSTSVGFGPEASAIVQQRIDPRALH